MKPYSCFGKHHSNMDSVCKWAESKRRAEPGRRSSRNSNSTAQSRHRVTNRAARAGAKQAIVEDLQ